MWKPKPTEIIGPLMDENARQSMKSYPVSSFLRHRRAPRRNAQDFWPSGLLSLAPKFSGTRGSSMLVGPFERNDLLI
jgi:hypothetical protein